MSFNNTLGINTVNRLVELKDILDNFKIGVDMLKKMTQFWTVFFIILILFSQTFSKEIKDEFEMKKYGLGLHMEQYKLSDMNTYTVGNFLNAAPANKIIMTINFNDNFRIEPQFGINWMNNKEENTKEKALFFSIGAFGMIQKYKTNFYGGVRFGYDTFFHEYPDIEEFDTGGQDERTFSRYIINPTIGVEYFVFKHFSFGGEIGLKYINVNRETDSSSLIENMNTDHFMTYSGLLLRFYF